jgi:hypothetical protein
MLVHPRAIYSEHQVTLTIARTAWIAARARWTFTAGLNALWACTVSACPVCHTAVGEQVRAGTFNSSFLARLFATLAPIPVLAAVVVCMYFGFPSFKGTGKKQ